MRRRRLAMHTIYSNVLLLLLFPIYRCLDVFCGNLTVFEQQRFGRNAVTISSQEASDLKQCLEICCSIPNCGGVSFDGILGDREGEPNCLLVSCNQKCDVNQRTELDYGVLSVIIQRTPISPTLQTQLNAIDNEISPVQHQQPQDGRGPYRQDSTLVPHLPPISRGSSAPYWVIGLAIVIAVCCVGLNLGLLSAYVCYRRQKSRKQKAHITSIKAPTLHAYNHAL